MDIQQRRDLFAQLPPYNNTDFTSAVHRVCETLRDAYAKTPDPVLKLHQIIAHDYLMYSKTRGLIANHGLGSGKSILAAAVGETAVSMGMPVLFISTKSLHANFSANLAKYYEMRGEALPQNHIQNNYTFITINASNMLMQLKRTVRGLEITDNLSEKTLGDDFKVNPLDGKTVIVDEAHDFLNSISNASDNAVGLYYMLRDAKDVKILLMTGSINVNSTFESTLGFNIVAGYPLFSEDYDDFKNKWLINGDNLDSDNPDNKLPTINPLKKDKLSTRMTGLVSTYNIPAEEAKKYFPTANPMQVIACPMSKYQYQNYVIAREKELEEVARSFMTAKKVALARSGGSSNSTYKIYSRQISYFMYPKEHCFFGKREGKFTYDKDVEGFQKESTKYVNVNDIGEYSSKIRILLSVISAYAPSGYLEDYKPIAKKMRKDIVDFTKIQATKIGPGNVYTEFVESGIVPLVEALKAAGMKHYELSDGDTVSKTGRFVVISGEVEAEMRAQYVEAFKQSGNKKGEIIFLLIYTSTGAQGLDTKYVRHTHADAYWNYTRINQHVGRARRYKSHMELPEDSRNFDNYMYLSDYPEGTTDKDPLYRTEPTTNWVMYRNSIINEYPNKQMRKIIENVSIDCGIYEQNPDCRLCRPTNSQSYARDVNVDYSLPDTCQYLYGERVEMIPVKVKNYSGETTYYYSKVSNRIRIFNDKKQEISQKSAEYKFVVSVLGL